MALESALGLDAFYHCEASTQIVQVPGTKLATQLVFEYMEGERSGNELTLPYVCLPEIPLVENPVGHISHSTQLAIVLCDY